jgi:hypothetical protein
LQHGAPAPSAEAEELNRRLAHLYGPGRPARIAAALRDDDVYLVVLADRGLRPGLVSLYLRPRDLGLPLLALEFGLPGREDEGLGERRLVRESLGRQALAVALGELALRGP